jgi:hypothetical protein
MQRREYFWYGVLVGMLIMAGTDALHWFITPASQSASSARAVGVALQATVALGAALALWLRYRIQFNRPNAA